MSPNKSNAWSINRTLFLSQSIPAFSTRPPVCFCKVRFREPQEMSKVFLDSEVELKMVGRGPDNAFAMHEKNKRTKVHVLLTYEATNKTGRHGTNNNHSPFRDKLNTCTFWYQPAIEKVGAVVPSTVWRTEANGLLALCMLVFRTIDYPLRGQCNTPKSLNVFPPMFFYSPFLLLKHQISRRTSEYTHVTLFQPLLYNC